MSRYFCHDNPDVLSLETTVVDRRPGAVALAATPLYPGGGGQLCDRGRLHWAGGEVAVAGIETTGGKHWHLLSQAGEIPDQVHVTAEPAFRRMMTEMHTATHILNAFVFQQFAGALVTGVQMNPDGTARMDFDLPDADNDRLRALEPLINDAIGQDLPLRCSYVPAEAALDEPGLIRSRSVAPPAAADGSIRIVEIVGLDRQACGGTHLASTGLCSPVRILKIDNKGRHNRRVRIGLVPGEG